MTYVFKKVKITFYKLISNIFNTGLCFTNESLKVIIFCGQLNILIDKFLR